MSIISKSASALGVIVTLVAAFATAAPAAQTSDKDVIEALRAGGLILVVRHGAALS